MNIHECDFQELKDIDYLKSIFKTLQEFIFDPAFPQSDEMLDLTKTMVKQSMKVM